MNIKELLEIESDPEILNFRFEHNNLPMWLYVRYYLFVSFISKYNNMEDPHVKVNPLSIPLSEKIKYLCWTLKKQPFRKRDVQILIIGAGVNCIIENNIYTSRLYDYVLSMRQNTILLETSFKFNFPRPRMYENRIFYYDLILILSKTLRVFTKIKSDDIKTIKKLISFIQNKFPLDTKIRNEIENRLLIQTKRIKISTYLHQKLFESLKPRILIIEDSHYGGFTEIIDLAKRNNIIVAEFQHGMVNRNSIPYNYHENLHKELQVYLPDYFLVFGQYFAERVKTPAKCRVIGYNYLNEKASKISSNKMVDILVISAGCIPQFYIEMCKSLRKVFPKYRILFRPHPSERPAIEQRYSKIIDMDIPIDAYNLYERLGECNIVLSGELSTVMFEALKYTPRVYLVRTNASKIYLEGDEPFVIADNIEDLIHKIENGKEASLDTIEYVWANNAKERFIEFLQKEIGLVL